MIVNYSQFFGSGSLGHEGTLGGKRVFIWGQSIPYFTLSINSWSFSCPSNAINYNNYNNASYSNNEAKFGLGGNSLSYTYCIPSYKSQAVTVTPSQNVQVFNPIDPYYMFYDYTGDVSTGNIYASLPVTNLYDVYSTATYISSPLSSIAGLNNNIFSAEGYFAVGNGYPNPDSTFIFPEPMMNFISASGFDVSANGNTYQFGAYNYDFFTGVGNSPSSLSGLNLASDGQYCNNDSQCYPQGATIWATGIYNNQNLDSSTENWGIGYYINVNPSNSSYISATSQYKQNNSSSAVNFNFNIPTPIVAN
jgi:hypothetical protein